jgi:hypothetical protein
MRRSAILAFFFVSLLGGIPSRAAGPDPETDRFNLSLGTYLVSFDTSAQLSPAGGAGTVIDMEEVLGLDDRRADIRLDGYWRFAKRHRLDFGLYTSSRKGTRILDEDIVWNDVTYEADAAVDSKYSLNYLKAAYRFAFLRDDRAEVGLSAGLATMRLAMEISGEGTVVENGVPQGVAFVREAEDVLAPVPVVGLYGSFVIRDGLFFRPSAEFFSFSASGMQGSLVDARMTVDWFFTERWGVGLGFARTRVEYEDEESDPRVKADAAYQGGVLYFSYAF